MDVKSDRNMNINRLTAGVGLIVLAVLFGGCPKNTGQTPDETSADEEAGEPPREFVWQREEMPLEANGQKTHLALRLQDGGVVVAGGRSRLGPWSSLASYYAPDPGEWNALPSLNRARAGSEIVELDDGRVVMIGGVGPQHRQYRSSEVLDARRSSWTEAPALPVRASRHAAAVLPDGQVLVVTPGSDSNATPAKGGECDEQNWESGVYRYDPAAGTWSKAATFGESRLHPELMGTETGAILVGGKRPPADKTRPNVMEFEPTDRVFIYDAASDAWREAPSMERARGRPVVRRLGPHRLLVTSYRQLDQPAEVYNLQDQTWRDVGAPAEARVWSPRRTEIPRGPIVQTDPRTIAVYSTSTDETGEWLELPKLPERRIHASVTRLGDGTVLVAAGVDGNKGAYRSSLRLTARPVTDGGVSKGLSTIDSAGYEARQRAEIAARQLLLGRETIAKVSQKVVERLRGSALFDRWKKRAETTGGRAVVATEAMTNETGLPIRANLAAVISFIETKLVSDFPVRVVDEGSQQALKEELRLQRESDAFANSDETPDADQTLLSGDFVVTGKVVRMDEPGEGDLAVSYRIVVRIVERKTSEIVFEEAFETTKRVE